MSAFGTISKNEFSRKPEANNNDFDDKTDLLSPRARKHLVKTTSITSQTMRDQKRSLTKRHFLMTEPSNLKTRNSKGRDTLFKDLQQVKVEPFATIDQAISSDEDQSSEVLRHVHAYVEAIRYGLCGIQETYH